MVRWMPLFPVALLALALPLAEGVGLARLGIAQRLRGQRASVHDVGALARNMSWGALPWMNETNGSVFWSTLCRGANTSGLPLPGDFTAANFSVAEAMADWEPMANTTCTEFLDGEYNDTLEALKACSNGRCGALVGNNCNSTVNGSSNYRLCATGSEREVQNGTRLMVKPKHYTPPRGLPRPPLQQDFWQSFCAQLGELSNLRLLHSKHRCEEAKVLAFPADVVPSPRKCAELAAVDSTCSSTFDFKGVTPAVCRCGLIATPCGTPSEDNDTDIWSVV